MRTVRWAQIALLAVVPACAHSSSGQGQNASTSSAKTAEAEVPALGDQTALAQDDTNDKIGRSTRTITLGSTEVEVPTTRSDAQAVVADGTTCSPWADDPAARCTFEEATSAGIR
jgi:hypothetical protein